MIEIALARHGRYLVSSNLADMLRPQVMVAAASGEREITLHAAHVDFTSRFAYRFFGLLRQELAAHKLPVCVRIDTGAYALAADKVREALRRAASPQLTSSAQLVADAKRRWMRQREIEAVAS